MRFKPLLAIALLAMSLPSSPASAATHDFEVRAGAIHPENPSVPYEYTRYYPDVLKVHRGQTVRWTMRGNQAVTAGFHTVTFSDAGRPAGIRNDDIPSTYAMTSEWTLGSDCGRDGAEPCVLDATSEFISSGIPPFGASPFDVTIDLEPGAYAYLCTIHPAMTGTIEVVADAEPLPTQDDIDALVESQVAADSAAADDVFAAGQVSNPTVDPESGQVVWPVKLGDSTADDHVSIVAFLPSSLSIGAGDRVVFDYDEHVSNEIHTVTFPSEVIDMWINGFYPSCDFDDPEAGMKGVPGLWNIVGPDCPGNLEVGLAPWMSASTPAAGNLVLTPTTLHDSGLLVPPGGTDVYSKPDGSFPRAFLADLPAAGEFSYVCAVHGRGMSGGVTVT